MYRKGRTNMKKILSALLSLILVLSPVLAFSAEFNFLEDYDAIETASASVLYLEADDDFDEEIITTGSGFVAFDSQTFVTNYHVIEDSVWIKAYDENYREYEVDKIVAIDKARDIAILSFMSSSDLKPLTLAADKNYNRGQPVAAIGYPQGVSSTFSTGIISAIVEEDGVKEIQFTAPISEGSSGGALFNKRGEVIGITSSTLVDSQNINYAVDIAHAIVLYAERDSEPSAIFSIKADTAVPDPQPVPEHAGKYPLILGDEAYVGTIDDPYLDPDVINVSENETVESFTLTYYCEDIDEEIIYIDSTDEYYSEFVYTEIIKPGQLVNPGEVSLSIYGSRIAYIFAAITNIRTTDGTTYDIPEDEWVFDYWTVE